MTTSIASTTAAAPGPAESHLHYFFSECLSVVIPPGNTLTENIIAYLPWLMSAVTIYSLLLAGNKNSKTWLVGLANQVLWLTWIIISKNYGLLPMNIAMWFIYIRNYRMWRRDELEERALQSDLFTNTVFSEASNTGSELRRLRRGS